MEYSNYIALDADGVFSDTFLGRLRRKGEVASDTRVSDFIANNPSLFDMNHLGKFDVRGSLSEAITLLSYLAKDTDSGFVFVSSWINTKETYIAVNELFKYVSGVKWDKPIVCAQISPVGSREDSFMTWIKENVDLSRNPKISAIDDSGDKHFPFLSVLRRMIAPCGRVGFTTDDYIRMVDILNYNCDHWGSWIKGSGKSFIDVPDPLLTDDHFYHLLKTTKPEDLQQAARIHLRLLKNN